MKAALAVWLVLMVMVTGVVACGSRSGAGPSEVDGTRGSQLEVADFPTSVQGPDLSGTGPPFPIYPTPRLIARFLVGGWVVPHGSEGQAEPFAETLKTAIITSDDALTGFLAGFELFLYRGNPASLSRTDFSKDVVVAAYYLWRPFKGDPLALLEVVKSDTGVEVVLELEKDPQGRERPFLLAPIQMAALERESLGGTGPVEFVFKVNGEIAGTETVRLR